MSATVISFNRLAVDRKEMARYARTLFRHAEPGTFAHLRAFVGDKPWRYREWRAVPIGDPKALARAAADLAQQCADAVEPVTFAPPVATFNDSRTASERTLANGLALLVELDDNAAAGRVTLQQTLGPATVVVESGGTYRNQATGKLLPRLHLYWRLAQPTRTPADHALLKEARQIARHLTGADGTAVPNCHPIRWPGSWHRKAAPRLARIVELNADVEIDLADMLDRLGRAAADAGITVTSPVQASEDPQAPIEDVISALAVIPNDKADWERWNRTGMATWRATGASAEGRDAFHKWSEKYDGYDFTVTEERWDHYSASPPTLIGWRALASAAHDADPTWRAPSQERIADESFDVIGDEPVPQAGRLHFIGYDDIEPRLETPTS